MAQSLIGMGWNLANQSDVDRCDETCRRIWFEAGVALQMNLNGVPNCLADVGDWHAGSMHPLGIAVPK